MSLNGLNRSEEPLDNSDQMWMQTLVVILDTNAWNWTHDSGSALGFVLGFSQEISALRLYVNLNNLDFDF